MWSLLEGGAYSDLWANDVALITGQQLLEAQRLLEEICIHQLNIQCLNFRILLLLAILI